MTSQQVAGGPPGAPGIDQRLQTNTAADDGGSVIDTEDDVLQTIAAALQPFRKDGAEITTATDISEDLNLDSLAVMDLMMELEEKFDVSIPLNLLPEVRTVGDLTATIRKLKEG